MLEPNDKALAAELRAVAARRKATVAKEKAMYSRMFGGLSE